jgi:nitric oxide reductase activation protein
MAWDEALFSVAWDGARRLLVPRAPTERRVEVEPERARLEALARLLSGRALTVTLTDEPGGLRGEVLFLPRVFDFAPTSELNREALLARVALNLVAAPAYVSRGVAVLDAALAAPGRRAAAVAQFPSLATLLPRLERAALDRRAPIDVADARAAAIEATVRLALGATPDGLLPEAAWAWAHAALGGAASALPAPRRTWFSRARSPEPVWLWGEEQPAVGLRAAPTSPGADADSLSNGAEAKKRAVTQLEHLPTPDDQLAENPLVHSFEKVHTLETYKGGSKRIDGDDELSAHQKALDELDLRQVVRSHQRARSLYRADVLLDGQVGDFDDDATGPVEATYDEWDEAARRWRRDWCRLTTRVVPVLPDAAREVQALRARLTKTTLGLRAVFEQLEASRAWRLRQRQGTDVDLAAVVDRYGALRAGHCSESRLYATRRRHSRDTAVLILLDASLSTDAWVANRRVLDVEKEAVLALGDALEGLFDDVAVAAFCSQSRRDCRFFVAKGFTESWTLGAQRVVSLTPGGFTRIGPALRHATAELGKRGARQKLLLLLSDGKPSDVDRYEGRYGVADVHRAVLDAQAVGVVTHALAMDPAAKAWLPSMFGHGRASVVSRPEDLVTALARVTTTALRR